MNEWMQINVFLSKIILIGLFAACYVVGGRRWKWVRRIVGSLIFGAGLIGLSLWQECFSWFLLLYPILLFGALTKGYGGDTTWEKIKRRFVYGLLLGLSCAPVAIVYSAYTLWICQVVLAILVSLVMGVLNPLNAAVEEEGIIATMSVILIPMMLVFPVR